MFVSTPVRTDCGFDVKSCQSSTVPMVGGVILAFRCSHAHHIWVMPVRRRGKQPERNSVSFISMSGRWKPPGK